MKKATNEAISISRYISNFLHGYAPVYMTGSENTLRSYETALTLYLEFLENSKSVSVETLNWRCFRKEYIEEWLVWLESKRNCKPESCNVRLGSFRSFLKYVGSKDASLVNIYQEATTIKIRNAPLRKVEGLSKDAVKTLLEMPDQSTSTGRRDLAFMILIYATATRVSEILSLKVRQLHLDGNKPYITVVGKRGKIRTAYILPKAVVHLKHYLKEFHGENPDSNE